MGAPHHRAGQSIPGHQPHHHHHLRELGNAKTSKETKSWLRGLPVPGGYYASHALHLIHTSTCLERASGLGPRRVLPPSSQADLRTLLSPKDKPWCSCALSVHTWNHTGYGLHCSCLQMAQGTSSHELDPDQANCLAETRPTLARERSLHPRCHQSPRGSPENSRTWHPGKPAVVNWKSVETGRCWERLHSAAPSSAPGLDYFWFLP